MSRTRADLLDSYRSHLALQRDLSGHTVRAYLVDINDLLSFLGVGLGSDVMSWGNDISAAQQSLRVAPMALIYPSIILTVTVLAFILLGELIRDALDPRARARR